MLQRRARAAGDLVNVMPPALHARARSLSGFVASVAVFAAAAHMGGCAQYQVRQASADPTQLEYQTVTSHAFFWGLVYDPEVQTVAGVDGINDVIVEDNLGYDILSVVTLGIWKPMTIRYRARAPLGGQPVEFPVPAPSPEDTTNGHQ